MNDKRKKILMLLSIGLFNLAIVSLGTYALWTTGGDLITGNNSISSGQVKMSYTETNEIGMNNALPISDKDGKKLNSYFDFSILTYIKTRANDDTQRKLNYNIVLEPLSVDNPLSDNEIKVYLTMVKDGVESVVVEPTTIDNLSDYILKSQEETFSNNKGEVITNYRLRAWIDESVDTNKLNAKSYSYRFRVNVNNDTVKSNLDNSGANVPELASNMIPVYYDNASDSWKKADSNNSNEDNKWYDYNNKMWANAVTVSDTNRSTYLNASAGTEISMDDINTMWVWIPRYTYTYLNTNTPEEIKIKFENGTNSTGTIKCTDAINQKDSDGNTISEICTDSTNGSLIAGTSTYTHPAFTFGDQELTGIWVGKFEVSSDIACTNSLYNSDNIGTGCNLQTIRPNIKPNVSPWVNANLGTFFNGIQKMTESNNKYGFTTSEDTHMMKNMDWGAVTYLSHSKYGINKEVAPNSSSTSTTGCGPQSEGSEAIGSTCNSYTTTLGQSASTTGNVYGIYDMSGGTAWELTMGDVVWTNGEVISGLSSSNEFNSAFTGILGDGTSFTGTYTFPESKYYDKYSYGTDTSKYTSGKLGDATKEMMTNDSNFSWYSDNKSFPINTSSWFKRGRYSSSSNSAGLFSIYGDTGVANTFSTTRAVLSIK